jgi:PadR family transcriptional regulator, regulatory protein PadR
MIPKELMAASSKPLVLSLLARGESYGYEIVQQIQACSAQQIEWTEGMLYPVLHRLEREGLLASKWKESDSGRQRKYYYLTAKGKASLQTERQQWLTVHHTLTKLWEPKYV